MVMNKSESRELIIGLDVGTFQTRVLVGEVLLDGNINVLGLGKQASTGLEKGGVIHVEAVSKAVMQAIGQAELIADCQIASVFLNISGRHIGYQNEKGMTPILGEEVTQNDIERVIEHACVSRFTEHRKVLHTLPEEYILDTQERILNPMGMSGMRLEAKVHMVTCADDMAKNLLKSVERCDLMVEDLVFSGVAAAEAVLTDDDRHIGVCLLDIGAGTTDMVVYTDGCLRHSHVLPIGGSQVTNDIAKVFKLSWRQAEDIKYKYAQLTTVNIDHEAVIEIPMIGGSGTIQVSQLKLVQVIQSRYEEIFELVYAVLEREGYHNKVASFVLTGGAVWGEEVSNMAADILKTSVRIGSPAKIGSAHSASRFQSAVGVGLLHFGMRKQAKQKLDVIPKEGFINWLFKAKSWLKGEF